MRSISNRLKTFKLQMIVHTPTISTAYSYYLEPLDQKSK